MVFQGSKLSIGNYYYFTLKTTSNLFLKKYVVSFKKKIQNKSLIANAFLIQYVVYHVYLPLFMYVMNNKCYTQAINKLLNCSTDEMYKKLINQPIIKLIYQPTDKLLNLHSSVGTRRSILPARVTGQTFMMVARSSRSAYTNQLINKSINKSINISINKSINISINKLINISVTPSPQPRSVL